MKKNFSKKIKLLKKYFEKKQEVLLAFLFGSFAKGFQMKESDLDIAVYFKNYHPTPSLLWQLKNQREKNNEFPAFYQKISKFLENYLKSK